MSALVMYKVMNNRPSSAGKEKHHGNKRVVLACMKIKARRVERAKSKHELEKLLPTEYE